MWWRSSSAPATSERSASAATIAATSYSDLAYSRPALPDDVVAGLVRYCAAFGLAYAAFDFVVTPDEEWVFLEGNAGGQFGWIEDAVSAPITEALADLLTRPASDDVACAALPFEQQPRLDRRRPDRTRRS